MLKTVLATVLVAAGAAPQGFSIELCKRVIAQIGRAVGEPNLKINWLPGTVAERVPNTGLQLLK